MQMLAAVQCHQKICQIDLFWLIFAALHFAGCPSELILGGLVALRRLRGNLDVPPASALNVVCF